MHILHNIVRGDTKISIFKNNWYNAHKKEVCERLFTGLGCMVEFQCFNWCLTMVYDLALLILDSAQLNFSIHLVLTDLSLNYTLHIGIMLVLTF